MQIDIKVPGRNLMRSNLRFQKVFIPGAVGWARLPTLCTAVLLCGLVLPAEPLEAQDPPRCGEAEIVQTLSLTDWESGLGAWTTGTYAVEKPSTFDTPNWAVTADLPDNRPGNAAFVPNLDIGDCGADDESGVLTLTSPAIAIPAGTEQPRITFSHWFEIEYGWDGGNVKISVNGGPYTLVPKTAFETGPYSDTLFDAFDEFGISYNTNPLAEQDAFTGPEDEQTSGTWIESRINLVGIAGAGDSIRLRFDFGVDACFGLVGWYVDDVEVYGCTDEPPPEEASLTLSNQVINDHGGTAVPSNWILTATGPSGFSGAGPSVTSGAGFQPGIYDLTASGGPTGYANSAWSCTGGNQVDQDSVTITEGAQVQCSITHNDVAPRLRLRKTIVNNDDGEITDPDAFGLRIDGDLVTNNIYYELMAGGHQVSEDGLEGYRGGFWGGACMPDGSVSLSIGQQATCTITNDDIGPNISINVGHAGGWFNPETSGQGILIDVVPEQQFMFVAWFTFTPAAGAEPFEQRWLTAQGNYSGDIANLTLYETLGGEFDDPQAVSTNPVGTITLGFSDCTAGVMSYRIDTEGLEGEIPLARLIPGSEDLCEQRDANQLQAVDINSGMNGGWFDPATSGQGFLIDALVDPVGGNFIFVAWFTYGDDSASGQRWLTAQGGFEGPTAAIDVYETTGGSFDDPRPVSTIGVGEMLIDFTTCSDGILGYSLPDEGLEGEIEITRLIPGGEALCETIAGTE